MNLVPNQLVPSAYRVPQQSTVDYYPAVRGAASLGQMVWQTTPIHMAQKALRGVRRNGVGQTDVTMGAGTLAFVALAYIVVTGALSYQAGKAMSPNPKGRSTWGWVGVPVGVLTGPWGLGVMGIVSNSRKS